MIFKSFYLIIVMLITVSYSVSDNNTETFAGSEAHNTFKMNRGGQACLMDIVRY